MGAIISIYFIAGLFFWWLAISVKQSDSTTTQQKIEQFFTIVFLWPFILIALKKYTK